MGVYNIDKIEQVTYGERVEQWVQSYTNNIAIVERNDTVTFQQLGIKIDAFAAYLLKNGFKKNDKVLIQLNNSIVFAVCCFAMFKIGVVPVLIYPACREKELDTYAKITQPKGYFLFRKYKGSDYTKIAEEVKQNHLCVELCLFEDEIAEMELDAYSLNEYQYERPNPLDTALIVLSGGSTGVPKLIARTHADHIYTSETIAEKCGFTSKSVYMVTMPIEHNFNTVGFIGTLSVGGCVVMCQSGSIEEMITLIEKNKVTATALVPSMASACAASVDQNNNRNAVSSLSLVQLGGAMCTQEVIKKVTDVFGCTVQQIYGMGEGIVFCTSYDDDPETILSCQGRNICPWDDIRVVDFDNNDVADGESGELIGRGPCIITGYYGDEQVNHEKFTTNGYLKTGDRARFVNGDCIQILGRIKDVINRGGEKIDPSEVEEYIQECNGVQDVVVIGIPDKLLGQKICAVIIGDHSIDALELKKQLIYKGIATYKIPDNFLYIDQWPLTAVKKVDKKVLLEWAISQLDTSNVDALLKHADEITDADTRTVIKIWIEVLQCPVNTEDNFIELGGNSLTGSEMLERLFKETGVSITMEEFYLNTDFVDFLNVYKNQRGDK